MVDEFCGSQIRSSFLWAERKSVTQTDGPKASCALEVRWVTVTQGGKNLPALDTIRSPEVLGPLGIQALIRQWERQFDRRQGSVAEVGLRRGERALGCEPGPLGMECGRESGS